MVLRKPNGLSLQRHKCGANSNAISMRITTISGFCINQIFKLSIVHFHSIQFIKIHAQNDILCNMAISKNRGTNSVAVCILNICASLITKHTQTNTSRRKNEYGQ